MTDPNIAHFKAVTDLTTTMIAALEKIMDIMDTLNQEQQMWCVKNLVALVESHKALDIPSFMPKQLTEGELPERMDLDNV